MIGLALQIMTLGGVLALLALVLGQRRAAPKTARRPLPEGMRRKVVFGGCVYCGRRATVADHVRPSSQGGTDDEGNLVPACELCNSSKASRLITEWDPAKVLRAIATEPKVYAELLRITRERPGQVEARSLARAEAEYVGAERDATLATNRLVGLSDAVRLGIVTISLEAARKARQRDPMFPEVRGGSAEGGSEYLYSPHELRVWERGRPGKNGEGQR